MDMNSPNVQATFVDDDDGTNASFLEPTEEQVQHEKALKPSGQIASVTFASLTFPSWYPSYYPDSVLNNTAGDNKHLHVCQYCFKYTAVAEEIGGHEDFCTFRQNVPGRLVYDKLPYSIYEVDGNDQKLFCQCLCLFAKLFLDNKSICYDVEGFHYYLLSQKTEQDSLVVSTSKIVGFFSKEKMSWDDYNLACILVFPPYQRKGLGNLLIAFSYELSRINGKTGSPEKPLSLLGTRGYLAYWTRTIAQSLTTSSRKTTLLVHDLSRKTSISPEDVISALKHLVQLDVLELINGKAVVSERRLAKWLKSDEKGARNMIDSQYVYMP